MLYDTVKAICEEKGTSLWRMEKELGFSNASICKWNDSEPGVHKVQKVANYLGVPIEQLLGNSDCGEQEGREQNASNQNQ